MKFNLLFTRSLVVAGTLAMALSCSDDPKPGNEEELITFVKLTFTKVGADPLEFTWTDPDGEIGSGLPVIDEVTLVKDAEYSMSISLGDQSSGTLNDITGDIMAEATDHQFFFQPDSNLEGAIDFAYNDEDENEN